MIDLSKRIENLYEIKLADKTILKIKKPTQALLIELTNLQDMVDKDNIKGLLEQFNKLVTRIFNRNTNGRVFTEEEIADMIDIDIANEIIQDYLTFTFNQLGE
ncbi:MAG: hypothetical protein VB064_03130 [Oscillospiraceae bacterium]|nr:hypothetical protein [Oscillospiraceae bacterium]